MTDTSPNLTKEKIARTAVSIADSSGMKSLSMRKLADKLGVEAMSLYHYIDDKQDLISSMMELIVPTIKRPEACESWQEAICERSRAMRQTLITHPWAAQEFVSGINVGSNMLTYSDRTVGYFRQAGFSYRLTDYAWNVIDSYIYGFTLQSQNFPFDASEYQAAAKQYLPMIPREQFPNIHDMSLQIINGSHDGIQDFDFGLELIIDGIEKIKKQEQRSEK